jgi:hypothetical protein
MMLQEKTSSRWNAIYGAMITAQCPRSHYLDQTGLADVALRQGMERTVEVFRRRTSPSSGTMPNCTQSHTTCSRGGRYSPLATDLTAREVNAQRTEADRDFH